MKLSKSQERLLDKLRNTPAEDLTPEDIEDLEELEQLEKKEEVEDPKPNTDLSEIKKGMEEILKCLKPQETPPQEKVEIPTPQPVITNQEVEQDQEQPQESKMKKILKAIW